MNRDDLGHLVLAICLFAIAGYVDAVGFLKLGHLFVSYMSGNTTQFAVATSHGEASKAAEAGGIVALFVIGVFGGRLLSNWAKHWRRPAVLLLDAALLGFATLIASSPTVVVPIVLAMGIQNAALHRAGEAKTALTYVTGALVNFGERLADAVTGAAPDEHWAWLPYLLFWVGLMIGAGIGARVYVDLGIEALVWPAAILVILAAITAGFAWFERKQEKATE